MWFKDAIKEILAVALTAAFITFTGMGLISIEVFVGIAVATITYIIEEKSKENLKREITMLKGKVDKP